MQFFSAGFLESKNNNYQIITYFWAYRFLWSPETMECLCSHGKTTCNQIWTSNEWNTIMQLLAILKIS